MKLSMIRHLALFALCSSLHAQQPAVKTEASPAPKQEAILVKPAAIKVKPLLDPESVPLAKPLESELPIAAKPTGVDALTLQIYLDQLTFGPGIIDGKPGLFTEHAVKAWNEVNGYPLDDWNTVMAAARKEVPEPYTMAEVPDILKKWVNPKLPNDRVLQSKVTRLSYRSVGELMAERYHTDLDYLVELNGAKKIYSLQAGNKIKVPNVAPFKIEAIAGVLHKADPVKSQRHVVVDTKRNQLRIFEATPLALAVEEDTGDAPAAAVPPVKKTKPAANRSLIATFPITPGKKQFIHYGMWELRTCVEFPSWRYDKSLLETGKRSTDKSKVFDLPSGPNSPVGVIWCGLNKSGIGLHGTADPETIGRAQSAGCIRLSNWDAIRLPTIIGIGATVEIR